MPAGVLEEAECRYRVQRHHAKWMVKVYQGWGYTMTAEAHLDEWKGHSRTQVQIQIKDGKIQSKKSCY